MKLILLTCLIYFVSAQVKLVDIKSLTFYKDKLTTGNRTSPVEQLECIGGDACNFFVPNTVQCINTGVNDFGEVQWDCSADLNDKYHFGEVYVSCEGYAYKSDPYILIGSCGLQYEIFNKSNNIFGQILWYLFIGILILIGLCCIGCCIGYYMDNRSNNYNSNNYFYDANIHDKPSAPPPVNPEYNKKTSSVYPDFRPPLAKPFIPHVYQESKPFAAKPRMSKKNITKPTIVTPVARPVSQPIQIPITPTYYATPTYCVPQIPVAPTPTIYNPPTYTETTTIVLPVIHELERARREKENREREKYAREERETRERERRDREKYAREEREALERERRDREKHAREEREALEREKQDREKQDREKRDREKHAREEREKREQSQQPSHNSHISHGYGGTRNR